MSASTDKPPVDRLATGIRMATVIVVLGTLAAAFHPAGHAPAAVSDETAARPAASAAPASDYFPARFPSPESVEPQAPTF